MADMPNDLWSGWIIVLTLLSFAGLAWLVLDVYFRARKDSDEAPDQVWDEDLREGGSAPPMWWFWMLLAAMVFSVIYLMLYPGLGSFKGALRWSQGHQVEHSYMDFRAEYGPLRERIAQTPLVELQQDRELMASAGRLFARECGACHTDEGLGQARLFPNLRDDHWQWGGSAEQVEQSIRQGRQAVMVSWQAALGEDGVGTVADYVLALSTGVPEAHPGKTRYQQFCVACHGMDGAGNPMLGAPSLKDSDWLYGGSREAVMQSIGQGRQGVMPAFGERLDDAQIRLLLAWLGRRES